MIVFSAGLKFLCISNFYRILRNLTSISSAVAYWFWVCSYSNNSLTITDIPPLRHREWGEWVKRSRFNSINLNTINSNICPNHGGIYRFQGEFGKILDRDKALRSLYRNIRCILEVIIEKGATEKGRINSEIGDWGNCAVLEVVLTREGKWGKWLSCAKGLPGETGGRRKLWDRTSHPLAIIEYVVWERGDWLN